MDHLKPVADWAKAHKMVCQYTNLPASEELVFANRAVKNEPGRYFWNLTLRWKGAMNGAHPVLEYTKDTRAKVRPEWASFVCQYAVKESAWTVPQTQIRNQLKAVLKTIEGVI
jgi:hypothetical protein